MHRTNTGVYQRHPVSEHWKVKDDPLAQRVLAEGGAIGFLERAGGVLLLRLAVFLSLIVLAAVAWIFDD